jgi:hypothetical protein
VSRRAAENIAMSTGRKALAGSYSATDTASEVVGLAVPISVDNVLPVQSGGDVAWMSAGPAGVERSEREEPAARTALLREQMMREAAETPERDEALQG